ncbi:MAG TPA: flagellar export chaperone FliS [Desulfotomaculum sp.]|nr:flagellar export chaperone FliS [Desulfotomaculum sp.]
MYAQHNPYQQYRENAILTAGQERLALMLLDGAVRFTRQAREHITAKDTSAAHHALVRTQNILGYLAATANVEVEVGQNLALLYDYIHDRLVEANIKKDKKPLDEALPLLEDLRDTWRQADNGEKPEGERQ